MATANAEINAFGNFLLLNLKELAKFDRRIDIGTFGAKLNIEANGKFILVKGAMAALRRDSGSSLTKDYNRKTIENLLEQSITLLLNQGIQLNPELRKAIFDAIRGYRWLLGTYSIENRSGLFDASLEKLNLIQQNFTDKLKAAINKMDQFHMWFGDVQPEMRMENYGQSVYMDDKDLLSNGICAGITTKWLVRWVVAGKQSMLDSSKPQTQQQSEFNLNIEQQFQEYRTKQHVRWTGDIAKYGSEAAATFQVKERLKRDMASDRIQDPGLSRLQKKGSGMFVAMNEQNVFKKGSNLEDAIKDATKLKATMAKSEKNAIRLWEKADQLSVKKNPDQNLLNKIYDKAGQESKKAFSLGIVAQRNAEFTGDMNRINRDQFLERLARAYQNAHSNQMRKMQFSQTMYFRDASDFEPELRSFFLPLISESEIALSINQRIGYYISWNAGPLANSRPYRRVIGIEGGHALGFHINQDRTFMAFDPNYGEFSCATADDLIKHFARWYSLYSKDTAIASYGCMKIYENQFEFMARDLMGMSN